MKTNNNIVHRARAYEHDKFKWNIRRVPKTLERNGGSIKHPARTCGVFVVHGIGEQKWNETSALLRSGFENAIAAIKQDRSGLQMETDPNEIEKKSFLLRI